MKKILLNLFFVLFLFACQPAPAPDELAPYYGYPKPAKIVIDGETYNSEIGTTQWITEVKPDGTMATVIGDAFAIITPKESIPVNGDLSFVLELPVPINPTELWYIVYKVSEDELSSQDLTQDAFRWNPDYKTQLYIEHTSPLLSDAQHLNFSLEAGIYIFEVHAGWGGTPPHTKLEADFGFLFEVQE